MIRRGDPASRLARALTRSAAAAGTPITIDAHRTRGWRSATFEGERHSLEASAIAGGALDRWLGDLGDLELAVPGCVVADLSLAACDRGQGMARFRIDGVTVTMG